MQIENIPQFIFILLQGAFIWGLKEFYSSFKTGNAEIKKDISDLKSRLISIDAKIEFSNQLNKKDIDAAHQAIREIRGTRRDI